MTSLVRSFCTFCLLASPLVGCGTSEMIGSAESENRVTPTGDGSQSTLTVSIPSETSVWFAIDSVDKPWVETGKGVVVGEGVHWVIFQKDNRTYSFPVSVEKGEHKEVALGFAKISSPIDPTFRDAISGRRKVMFEELGPSLDVAQHLVTVSLATPLPDLMTVRMWETGQFFADDSLFRDPVLLLPGHYRVDNGAGALAPSVEFDVTGGELTEINVPLDNRLASVDLVFGKRDFSSRFPGVGVSCGRVGTPADDMRRVEWRASNVTTYTNLGTFFLPLTEPVECFYSVNGSWSDMFRVDPAQRLELQVARLDVDDVVLPETGATVSGSFTAAKYLGDVPQTQHAARGFTRGGVDLAPGRYLLTTKYNVNGAERTTMQDVLLK